MNRLRPLVAVCLLSLVLLAACGLPGHGAGQPSASWSIPDQARTPGDIKPGCTYPVTAARNVSAALKAQVRSQYHYTGPADLAHSEIDHRVPHSLCGADTLSNLWPEPADGIQQSKYIHNRKDDLEGVIADRVRHHVMTLTAAQHVFLGDWRIAYCRYVISPVGCDSHG